MSALIRSLVVLLALTAPAFGDGSTRVILADADPELQRAVIATLAPWRLEVVIEPDVASDTLQSRTDARFVVWRANGELVVFDRERGEAEHREAPTGALDPASAAAAALTVKTLMRLPPPEVAETTPPEKPVIEIPAQTHEPGPELRLQAGAGARMTEARDFDARANVIAMVRPGHLPVRIGLAGELGSGIDVRDMGFRGTWSDWSVAALVSYAFEVAPRWEIEPYVGAGVLRSKLDGSEGMMIERHERATLALVRAGTFVRVHAGTFSFGGFVGVDGFAGTPTYTRNGSGSQFFAVPPFALSLGAFAAADLGR